MVKICTNILVYGSPTHFSMEHDWTYFIRKMYYKTSKKKLFDMWINPAKITEFWLEKAEYYDPVTKEGKPLPEGGIDYHWTFSSGHDMRGKILDIEPEKRFKFTFGKRSKGSDKYIHVTLLFKDEENGSSIELLQENIEDNEYNRVHYYVSCQLGWMHALLNLKSVVENEIDLRIKGHQQAIDTVGISLSREQSRF